MNDFAMSNDGDLLVHNGQPLGASDYPVENDIYLSSNRHKVQLLIMALRTTIKSLTIHDTFGHDLDRLIGQHHTLELEDRIRTTLLDTVAQIIEDIRVHVIPLGPGFIAVFVACRFPGLNIVVSMEYSMDEGLLIGGNNFIF